MNDKKCDFSFFFGNGKRNKTENKIKTTIS